MGYEPKDDGRAGRWDDAAERLRDGLRAASRRRFSVRDRSGAQVAVLPLPVAIVLAFVLIAWRPLLALVAIGIALAAGARFVIEVEVRPEGRPSAGPGPDAGA